MNCQKPVFEYASDSRKLADQNRLHLLGETNHEIENLLKAKLTSYNLPFQRNLVLVCTNTSDFVDFHRDKYFQSVSITPLLYILTFRLHGRLRTE